MAILDAVDQVARADDTVIELGPGTGVFSKALIQRRQRGQLGGYIGIELSLELTDQLIAKYPGETFIHGDARNLDQYIPSDGGRLIIVSSLPLKLMRRIDVQRIAAQGAKLLSSRGGYIFQYTYGMVNPFGKTVPSLQAECVGTIFLNFPPAKIWRYHARGNGDASN